MLNKLERYCSKRTESLMTNEVLGGGTFSSRITLGLILGDWSAAEINKSGSKREFDFSCITPETLYAKENGDQELTALRQSSPMSITSCLGV